MTKKELVSKINEFLAAQDNSDRDEWYVTDQEAARQVLTEFAQFVGLKLNS